MGVQNNTVRSVIVTALGLALQQRYLKFMQALDHNDHNDFIDWVELKDELNGNFSKYLLPTGIMAKNVDVIMTGHVARFSSDNPESANKTKYKFNFADMEDDAIQELVDAGYVKILD